MKWLGYLIVALLFVAAGWFLFEIGREILRLYSEAENDLKLGVITAAGSALAFVANNAIQSSRERRARLFEAKREAYGEFFESFMSFFHGVAGGRKPTEAELIKAIQGLSTDVMTWGGAETVNAFNNFQRANAAPANNDRELFLRTETFLRALRRDLGHSDGSLKSFALTKLIVRGDEHHKFD